MASSARRPQIMLFYRHALTVAVAMLAAFLLPGAHVAAADSIAADAEGIAVFENQVRPILAEHCHKCHSHSADKIKGGLVLDSRDGALHGGDSGPAIVPGAPDKSLLIEAIGYSNEDLQMPPKGKKLTDRQIAILTEWVRRGAPWPVSKTASATRPRGVITEEDRNWWAFRPVARVEPPRTDGDEWVRNEIDRFIIHRLKAEGLRPAERASRTTLLRRVFFNVIGLPPSPEEIAAFVADPSPNAFEKVVDRLLASPHYGERWARHWLDLVRYAESDGFRIDDYRPHAWRYRDYVIRAFNEDKPYDRFIEEQIAGDEIAPLDPEARVATGFLRHWVYEYNNRDVVGQWNNILNDITDVTADVFLALGVQCARCHDHKFDPILQKDYFRLQAFFAPILPRDDLTLAAPEAEREYQAKLRIWEEKTAELRRQIAVIEEPHKTKAAEAAIIKFPPETQALIRKPVQERTPWEHQIAELAYRQVTYEYDRLLNKMKGADKDRLVMLYKELATFDKEKPAAPAQVICVTDVGRAAPPVRIPKRKDEEIAPGYLTLLDEKPALIRGAFAESTGRRAELARWLTDPENPLTARVMVNRIWQYHFGRGLVGTSSDFGRLGEKPSHPELLDWLARRFVEGGWSMKKLHRLILLSASYQQGADNPQREMARLKDPENRWCWRGSTRRLEAEQIRDAILSATGELELTAGGPSADHATARRTIYTKSVRNVRDPLLDVFDAPEGFASSAQRNVTTTPTQSLLMMNSAWSLQRARAFAGRLAKESSLDDERLLTDAYQLALGRLPSRGEIDRTRRFLETQTEVIAARKPEAKPAPFQSDKMPFRDGRAAVFTPGGVQERLTTTENGSLPGGDFTVEAFIVLRSLYETGDVRTIVSHWDGKRGHPGWSFGVTSKQSRYKPQTLVLLLSGDQPWSERDPVEPLFSGLHIELGKPYFVAVTVDVDEPGETGVTFYAKDLSNDDEPMQVAQLAHKVTSGIQSAAPVTIGARSADGSHLFDGLIDDVRISTGALAVEQLLLSNERFGERTAGWWKFENDPGVYEDSSGRGHGIVARAIESPREEPRLAALVDFCHVLLNSNEFIYLD